MCCAPGLNLWAATVCQTGSPHATHVRRRPVIPQFRALARCGAAARRRVVVAGGRGRTLWPRSFAMAPPCREHDALVAMQRCARILLSSARPRHAFPSPNSGLHRPRSDRLRRNWGRARPDLEGWLRSNKVHRVRPISFSIRARLGRCPPDLGSVRATTGSLRPNSPQIR